MTETGAADPLLRYGPNLLEQNPPLRTLLWMTQLTLPTGWPWDWGAGLPFVVNETFKQLPSKEGANILK